MRSWSFVTLISPALCRIIRINPPRPYDLTVRAAIMDVHTLAQHASIPERRWEGNGPTPADDTSWNNFVCKGTKLLKALKTKDEERAGKFFNPPMISVASKFQDFPKEFDAWGYTETGYDCDMSEHHYGLEHALIKLAVSSNPKDWECRARIHGSLNEKAGSLDKQTYSGPNGRKRVTGAFYAMALNKNSGVIVFDRRYSPTHAAKYRKPPVQDLPDLQRGSDVTWGIWKEHSGSMVGKINYIFSWAVEDHATRSVINRVLNHHGKQLTTWPGVTFAAKSEDGKAILGTPHGVAVSLFLIQHRKELGTMSVEGIDIFLPNSTEASQPSILFTIKDPMWIGISKDGLPGLFAFPPRPLGGPGPPKELPLMVEAADEKSTGTIE